MGIQTLYGFMLLAGGAAVAFGLKQLIKTSATYPIATAYYRGTISLLYALLAFYAALFISPLISTLTYTFSNSALALLFGVLVFILIKATLFVLRKNDVYRTLEFRRKKFQKNAKKDQLTGAFAAEDFKIMIEEAIALTKFNQQYALLFIDIEKLDEINNQHGRSTGDAVLIALSNSLKNTLRANDIIARVGDDEFCILAKLGAEKHFSPHIEALMIRLKSIEIHYSQHITTPLKLSVGAFSIKKGCLTANECIDNATDACLDAKSLARHGFINFSIYQQS